MDADWGAILFKNGTAETIPAGGLVEPDGTLTPEGVLVGRKPTRNGSLAVLVNDQAEVLAGQYGQCRPAVPWATLAVHADDTVLAADTLGSKSGDWYARKGFAGFRPIGPAYSGFVPVVAEGSSSNGSGQMVVMATAPNDGQQWTTGLVQRFTSTGDLTAASPFEVVELKPLHESERLVSGQPYLCVDTGARGAAGRRRLRAERLGGNGTPTGYVRVVTDVVCVGDDLVKTYTNIPVYS